MSENSSVDSAALRREARRKRILENSEKRLRSITGRPVSNPHETQRESDNCLLHDFQNVRKSDLFPESDRNISPAWDADKDVPSFTSLVGDGIKDDILRTKVRETSNFNSSWMKSLVQKRFHLIIVPIIVQLMYIFKLGHLFYNNLFCPFITVKLMEFFMVHEIFDTDIKEQLALASAMFSGSMARHVLKAFYILAVTISDFCLYIFMIVASDKLFSVTFSSYIAQ